MGFSEVNGINTSTSDFQWKLIYDNSSKEIITLDKYNGVTRTKKDAYASTSFLDIANHIQTNSLNYNAITIKDYNFFYTEAMKDLSSPANDDIISLIESFHPDNWTLVYESGTVYDLTQVAIRINGSQSVFTSANIEDCFDKITELSLTFPQQADFEAQYPIYFGLE